MMNEFKHFLPTISGLQYVYEQMPICSSIGKTCLLEHPWLGDSTSLIAAFNQLEQHIQFVKHQDAAEILLVQYLHELVDIRHTLQHLQQLQVLDDVELFEIKKMALLSQKVAKLLQDFGYKGVVLNDLSKVVHHLDPDGSRVAYFYIYSSYDEQLASLRTQINMCEDVAKKEQLQWEAARIEDSIRQRLTEMLQPYAEALLANLQALAELDVWNAKAQLAISWNACKPSVADQVTVYQQLVHPQVRDLLVQEGRTFQPIDIQLSQGPCLITGANMAGKTLVLKSLALSQVLFQFGFFLPAQCADVVPVESISYVIDDQQSEKKGLSSFAVEIININEIITQVKQGHRLLVLVDELARTTNPEEGKQIVQGFLEMMKRYQVRAVVTTHYSGIDVECQRLRVNGLKINEINSSITPKNLYKYMDYSLTATDIDDVPAEALKIAEIFCADAEFLQCTRNRNIHLK